MKNLNIAVIVVVYNRPASFKRLLNSISNAFYPEYLDPELIISIDNSGSNECFDVAEAFNWEHGNKKVIHHRKNLGLKEHILKCGDLSSEYDFIILLEDDLFVSKYFMDFSLKVHEKYQGEKKIAGYSLYSYHYNETALKYFEPLHDGSDVYFLQLPSSWGQVWTGDQWSEFRFWLDNKYSQDLIANYIVPENVINWPDTSWKKLFIFYMIVKDLYFVYPRVSLTTNFMDIGVHYLVEGSHLQVTLQSYPIEYDFMGTNDTDVFYDAFCELSPDTFKKNMKQFVPFDFEVDLYGTKPLGKIKSQYMLTGRASCNPLFHYALSLKPQELNVLYDIEGNDIFFARKSTISDNRYQSSETIRNSYYYNIPGFILKSKDVATVVERSGGSQYCDIVKRSSWGSVKCITYKVIKKIFPANTRRRKYLLAILNRLGL